MILDKVKVRRRFPDAVCKTNGGRMERPFFSIHVGNELWGLGDSENSAWFDARRTIEKREGVRL